MLLYCLYLRPSSLEAHLSLAHTRLPTYHFKSIAAKCAFLSYRTPSTTTGASATGSVAFPSGLMGGLLREHYLKGIDDLYFVVFYSVVFTFLREAMMRFLWIPVAEKGGITRRGTVVRFAEQGWALSSWGISWLCGLYIMQRSPYKNLNVECLWKGYPHYRMGGDIKAFYLIECGFWLHQVVALHVEKRRKDHWQVRRRIRKGANAEEKGAVWSSSCEHPRRKGDGG